MHPHRTDAGHAWLYVRRAHARHTRLADVGAQPTPRCDTHDIGNVRCDQYLAYGMRCGDLLLLRSGLNAHLRRRELRRNEALDRLVGIFRWLTRSKVRR